MKKVLLITSLCAVGRAGMYPQILAFSRAGVQACPLPSVLLSTHTGGLGTPAKAVLTSTVADALEHYLSLGIKFDALLTGYLPEPQIADAILSFVERGGADIYVCDPVMADGGRFYGGMGEEQAAALRRLAASANAITPNTTEAAILLGRDPSCEHDAAELACSLAADGRAAIVTGGGDAEHIKVTVAEGAAASELTAPRVEGKFIGTGDSFAAEFTLALLDGCGAVDAARRAVDAVSTAVGLAKLSTDDWRLGMPVEGVHIDR